MKILHRSHVNKKKAAHKFKKNVKKTKSANLKTNPMRGGIRL